MKGVGVFLLCCSLVLQTSCDRKQGRSEEKNLNSLAKEIKSADIGEINNSRKSAKLAFVSLRDIAQKSDAGQNIDKQIAGINDKSKEDLLELESSIKKMDSNIKTDSDERKVEDLQVILYDMTKEKRYQIQEAYRTAVEILEKEIHKVVKEIADEKGYSLVVLSDVVVYNSQECPDITEEAIKRLNNRIPEIKVNMEKLHSERKQDDR